MNVSRFATLSTRKCARAPSLRTTEEDPLPLMDTELPPQTDTESQLQMSTEVLQLLFAGRKPGSSAARSQTR